MVLSSQTFIGKRLEYSSAIISSSPFNFIIPNLSPLENDKKVFPQFKKVLCFQSFLFRRFSEKRKSFSGQINLSINGLINGCGRKIEFPLNLYLLNIFDEEIENFSIPFPFSAIGRWFKGRNRPSHSLIHLTKYLFLIKLRQRKVSK